MGDSMNKTLLVKTIDRTCFSCDISDPSTSVFHVQRQLQTLRAGEQMRLVFKGRVLDPELLVNQLSLQTGDFLVALPQGKQKPGTHKPISAASESVSTPDDEPLRLGERLEGAWNFGSHVEWLPCIVYVADYEQNVYTVKWEGEEAFTEGIKRQFLRRTTAVEALNANHVGGMQQVPPVEIGRELLGMALQDSSFQDFLQSPEMEKSLKPLKDMILHAPELLPDALDGIKTSNPDMWVFIAPFLLALLEEHHPAMLVELAPMLSSTS